MRSACLHRSPKCAAVLVAVVWGSLAAPGDEILINLEWRPAAQTVYVGDTVEVELWAVAQQDMQLFRALDMVVAWEPGFLGLQGVNDDDPTQLMYSGFPAGDPYNLNEAVPPADGDGYYQALAPLGVPIEVTTGGVLLTNFLFTALVPTPATPLEIPAVGGLPSVETTVWGGPGANTKVTGTLGGAWVEIIPEPGTLMLLLVASCAARRRR